MNESLIIAFLALLSIGSLAAVFVLWAKLDEQKKLTQEEKEKRWDETSRSVGLEKKVEDITERFICMNATARYQFNRGVDLYEKNMKLQDRLSALLCPRNDHVWKDGVCVKCGRVKDD